MGKYCNKNGDSESIACWGADHSARPDIGRCAKILTSVKRESYLWHILSNPQRLNDKPHFGAALVQGHHFDILFFFSYWKQIVSIFISKFLSFYIHFLHTRTHFPVFLWIWRSYIRRQKWPRRTMTKSKSKRSKVLLDTLIQVSKIKQYWHVWRKVEDWLEIFQAIYPGLSVFAYTKTDLCRAIAFDPVLKHCFMQYGTLSNRHGIYFDNHKNGGKG